MESGTVTNRSTRALGGKSRYASVAYGVGLRIGFVGVCALAAGLIGLFDGEVNRLSGIAMVVGGGLMAAFGWWRARTVLDIADARVRAAADASSRASARAAAGV